MMSTPFAFDIVENSMRVYSRSSLAEVQSRQIPVRESLWNGG